MTIKSLDLPHSYDLHLSIFVLRKPTKLDLQTTGVHTLTKAAILKHLQAPLGPIGQINHLSIWS